MTTKKDIYVLKPNGEDDFQFERSVQGLEMVSLITSIRQQLYSIFLHNKQ
jgi:hypothetical protein